MAIMKVYGFQFEYIIEAIVVIIMGTLLMM
jgi:hypothetical protein